MKKKITFEYPDELALALRKGREFTSECGDGFFYDEGECNPFRVKIKSDLSGSEKVDGINGLWRAPNGLYEEVEPKWPEDFRPCWCWVSDVDPAKKEAKDYVVEYNPGNLFKTAINTWRYATPMTESEVIELCWSNQLNNKTET